MKKRRIIMLALALTLVLGMAATAFAATSPSDLSEIQKQELYALHEQRLALHELTIDKYEELGLITEEQATAMRERIVERNEYMLENGIVPGMGGGFGNGLRPRQGNNGFGGGFGGGFGQGRGCGNCINEITEI